MAFNLDMPDTELNELEKKVFGDEAAPENPDGAPTTEKQPEDKLVVEQPKKEEPAQQSPLTEDGKDKSAADKTVSADDKSKVEPEIKPDDKANLIAGTFKTNTDLAKGLREIGKKLGYQDKALDVALKQAEKTGDYSQIEDFYKDLRTELSQAKPAVEEPKIPRTVEDYLPPDQSGKTLQQEIHESANERGFQIADKSDAGQILIAQGYTPPRSAEEWSEIARERPDLYSVLKDYAAIHDATYKESAKAAVDFAKAVYELPNEIKRVAESAKTRIITDFKTKGIELTDVQATSFVEDALNNPSNFEVKFNQLYWPREDAIVNSVKASKIDELWEPMRKVQDARARTQAIEDLTKQQKQVPGTISNSGKAPTRVQRTEVDYANKNEVELISESEIDKAIDKRLLAE